MKWTCGSNDIKIKLPSILDFLHSASLLIKSKQHAPYYLLQHYKDVNVDGSFLLGLLETLNQSTLECKLRNALSYVLLIQHYEKLLERG